MPKGEGATPIEGIGRKIAVDVRGQRFHAVVEGEDFYADTWEALETKVKTKLRKAKPKVEVPFMRIVDDGNSFRSRRTRGATKYGPIIVAGVATGLHGGTGNVLITWDDGTKEQDSYYSRSGHTIKSLNDKDREHLQKLLDERHDLDERIREIESRNSFDLKPAVEQAVEAKLAEIEEPEAATG